MDSAVQSLPELRALLVLLREQGVTTYQTPALTLVLAASFSTPEEPKTAAQFAREEGLLSHIDDPYGMTPKRNAYDSPALWPSGKPPEFDK